MEQIRYDGNNLIYKWKAKTANRNKDNAIQWGSSLRVQKGQAAIFTCYKDGKNYTDIIEGPYDELLDTKNLPVISSVIGLFYKGGTPFQAEVYFVNKQQLIQLKFGIPYFDVFDCKYTDFSVPVSVRGSLNLRIKDTDEFTNIFGLRDLSNDDFRDFINGALTRYVKTTVLNIPEVANLPVLKIEKNIDAISQVIEAVLRDRLSNEFGTELLSLDVEAININKNCEDYEDLIKLGKKRSFKEILSKARIFRAKENAAVANEAIEMGAKVVDIAERIIGIITGAAPVINTIQKMAKK